MSWALPWASGVTSMIDANDSLIPRSVFSVLLAKTSSWERTFSLLLMNMSLKVDVYRGVLIRHSWTTAREQEQTTRPAGLMLLARSCLRATVTARRASKSVHSRQNTAFVDGRSANNKRFIAVWYLLYRSPALPIRPATCIDW